MANFLHKPAKYFPLKFAARETGDAKRHTRDVRHHMRRQTGDVRQERVLRHLFQKIGNQKYKLAVAAKSARRG